MEREIIRDAAFRAACKYLSRDLADALAEGMMKEIAHMEAPPTRSPYPEYNPEESVPGGAVFYDMARRAYVDELGNVVLSKWDARANPDLFDAVRPRLRNRTTPHEVTPGRWEDDGGRPGDDGGRPGDDGGNPGPDAPKVGTTHQVGTVDRVAASSTASGSITPRTPKLPFVYYDVEKKSWVDSAGEKWSEADVGKIARRHFPYRKGDAISF